MKLTQLIAQYVTFRKSLGQNFESNEWRLHTFSRFVGESADIRSVKPRQVAAFLAGRGPITRYWHGSMARCADSSAMRSLVVISPHHHCPPPYPNYRRALSLTFTPRRNCAACSTARRPIRNIRRES